MAYAQWYTILLFRYTRKFSTIKSVDLLNDRLRVIGVNIAAILV